MSNSKLKKITSARLFLPIVCLIAVLLINVIKTPDFFNITIRNGVLYGYVIDVINRASELVILAVGMTLVTAASGGQDISVGAVMAVAAAVCCQILSGGASSVTAYQNSLVLAVIAALLASALCGAFNGLLVAKLNIQPMVATLILYTAGRGIAQLVTNGQITYIRVESFQMAGGYIGKSPVPTPVLFAIVTVVIVAIILKKTALGLYIESVGINGKAARLVGLNSTMIKFLTYVICGVLAGIAGLVASSRIYSADANNIGLNLEMDAILAVALGGNFLGGGKFSLIGSVIGAYTIQALTTTLYAMNVEIMKQRKKMTSTGFLLLITIVLFFVMYAAGMVIFADKGFAKPQMFLNLFVSNAGLLVISCGLTIVMITGGIDISVGSVTALVCMVMADLMENKGVSAYVAVLAALLIGLAFGIVQGFLVTYMGIQPFIVTLAGMFFGRGMTAIISTDMISIKNEVFLKWANYRFYMPFGSTNKKGKFIPAYIPPTVVIAIIVVLIIAVLLKYFKFGRKLYAIGGNRQSALMMGLDVKKTMFRAYVLDGFLAGLGGFLFCLNSCAGFVEQAKGLEMDAISSAVIGGTLLSGGVGTPIGSMFGVLIKGTISSLITAQGTLSSWWVRIVLSALLCFFIVIQSVLASAKKKK